MASVNSVEKSFDSIVSEATGYADFVDKWADAAGKLASDLPGNFGGDADKVIALADEVTKALNALNAYLSA
jgi:hypothetical protein